MRYYEPWDNEKNIQLCAVSLVSGEDLRHTHLIVRSAGRWDSWGEPGVWFWYMDWVGGTSISMMFVLFSALMIVSCQACARKYSGKPFVLPVAHEDRLSKEILLKLFKTLSDKIAEVEDDDEDAGDDLEKPPLGEPFVRSCCPLQCQ